MERTSLSKSLKDHCIGSNGTPKGDSHTIPDKRSNFHNVLKPRSVRADHTDLRAGGGGPASWPPRSYSCGFCKREFRSAQALGGHMNVHRRDRARLRLSSPPSSSDDCPVLSLNPNANRNPNPSPTSGPPRFRSSFPSLSSSTAPHHLHLLALPSSTANVKLAGFKFSSSSTLKNGPSSTEAFHKQSVTTSHYMQGEGSTYLRNDPLSLEIGNLFGKALKAVDIDLELRLGYS